MTGWPDQDPVVDAFDDIGDAATSMFDEAEHSTDAFDSVGEAIEATERMVRLLDQLPPSVVRCDLCGRIVQRFKSGGEIRARPDSACPEHGPLVTPIAGWWLREWERRGRPDRLNVRLAPATS